VIENAESRARLSQLAEEQAALRRVATLVARGTPAQELFAAVAEEVGRLLPVGSAAMGRYDPDGMFTTVAAWSATDVAFGVGQRWPPDGKHVTGIVFRTGRPARLDDFSDASGPVGDHAREAGYRSAVGTPIMVEGRLWGVMTAATTAEEPLPESTETRLASFTELVATAIANTESRVGLARLAEEQAALRRVAELVARHSSPDEVFTAVSEAVGILLGADLAAMHVFPGDGEATTIAGWSAAGPMLPIGTRLPLDGDSVVARIFRTGEAARMDTYVGVEGETATVARGLSLRTTVGAPIHVDGQLWGALMAATRGVDPFPDDAETRIAVFTRLVATAISNTEAREAVARLADEQSALRRVATLVAQGVRAAEIFSAVSDEVARLLGSSAAVLRFEHGPPPAVFVVGSSNSVDLPPGTRVELEDGMATAKVYRDGRSARADRTASSPGPTDATMRRHRCEPRRRGGSALGRDGRRVGRRSAAARRRGSP
jgi:GAF domain-containing protein